MERIFKQFPAGLFVIDLRYSEKALSWHKLCSQIKTRVPFNVVLWICPARMWAQQQKEFIETIQIIRHLTDKGGPTGPTALCCPDFMALDWIGPVRALAIPIFGTTLELEWTDANGHSQRCSPLNPPPPFADNTTWVQWHGKRPKVDLL